MISNSIAEMRTYGEGFIIADQSPSMLDMSAIRNTNTKIVMVLPDHQDREVAGKAMGLSDQQIEEISRQKKGQAIVYQNNWEEAVQCKINKSDCVEQMYKPKNIKIKLEKTIDKSDLDVVRFILLPFLERPMKCNILKVKKSIDCSSLLDEEKEQINSWLDEFNSKARFTGLENNKENLGKLLTTYLRLEDHLLSLQNKDLDSDTLRRILIDSIQYRVPDLEERELEFLSKNILKNRIL